MSLLKSLMDSAMTVIPYTLILVVVLIWTRKAFHQTDFSRFRVILLLLMTPHLLVWLPGYLYQWLLLDRNYSFPASVGLSFVIEIILMVAFLTGLLKLVRLLKTINYYADRA